MMRAKAALAVLGLLAVVTLGCVQVAVVPGAEVTEKGVIWFTAEGESVVAKEGDPVALNEAKVAAAIIAKANLLEKIKGAELSSKVKVGDLMFESQEATATVYGYLARVTVVYTPQPRGLEAQMVKATASLALSREEAKNLAKYVE